MEAAATVAVAATAAAAAAAVKDEPRIDSGNSQPHTHTHRINRILILIKEIDSNESNGADAERSGKFQLKTKF